MSFVAAEDGHVVLETKFSAAGRFRCGLAWFQHGSKFGYIDERGTIVVAVSFHDATDFSEDYAAVSDGEQWGIIGRTGKWRLEPRFSTKPGRVSNGIFSVGLDSGNAPSANMHET